eukprot:7437040-Alexandrium_andersonii.AAC.1
MAVPRGRAPMVRFRGVALASTCGEQGAGNHLNFCTSWLQGRSALESQRRAFGVAPLRSRGGR